jgi:hypothetical protein
MPVAVAKPIVINCQGTEVCRDEKKKEKEVVPRWERTNNSILIGL